MTWTPVGSNSALVASSPRTLRQNSTTANWKPKQIPKKGTSFSRAKRMASIFPSLPRGPNPCATKIPCTAFSVSRACGSSASTSLTSMPPPRALAACLIASLMLKYASSNIYLPTMATDREIGGFFITSQGMAAFLSRASFSTR